MNLNTKDKEIYKFHKSRRPFSEVIHPSTLPNGNGIDNNQKNLSKNENKRIQHKRTPENWIYHAQYTSEESEQLETLLREKGIYC